MKMKEEMGHNKYTEMARQTLEKKIQSEINMAPEPRTRKYRNKSGH